MNDTPETRPTLRVALRVLGQRITVEAPQPGEQARLDEVLPLLRAIDDRAIGLAVQRSEAADEPISCRKGCSTCCRAQPVPVTPPEAHALLRLVEAMPEPRRTDIRQRFAERVERLRTAGLLAPFLDRDPDLSNAAARAIAERYFGLGLVCPFLEDDACSIYADRPFVCRQYLVTSPPELCADPFHNPVKPLRVPLAAAGAVLETATELLGRPQYTVPLVLALDYTTVHRAELERTFSSPDLFQRSLSALSRPAAEDEPAGTARQEPSP